MVKKTMAPTHNIVSPKAFIITIIIYDSFEIKIKPHTRPIDSLGQAYNILLFFLNIYKICPIKPTIFLQ